ncbi:MAG: formate/nitrite transporter family protein [Erysipelotrichaceae bacterium]|jgi:formate/nitrite transporter FocA (FNT family)|nr:formate/nitrite transporter family protein [Erysipelotrichaceae bacterium]
MKAFKTLVSGIFAGVLIGCGAIAFLLCRIYLNNPVLGAFIFGIGLFLICLLGLFLYTGQIGFIIGKKHKKQFVIELLLMLLGNLVGAFLIGLVFRSGVRLDNNWEFVNRMKEFTDAKVVTFADGGRNILTLLSFSSVCGAFVYLGVYLFKKENLHPLLKTVGLFACVAIFVMSGFEHSIALVAYLALGWQLIDMIGFALLSILIAIIGNSLGAILVALALDFLQNHKVSE